MDCVEPLLLQVENRSKSTSFLPLALSENKRTNAISEDTDSQWKLQHRSSNWANRKLVLTKENPFDQLQVSSTKALDSQEGRQPCSKCCKPRKYFCYTCRLALPSLVPHLPRVELPIQVDIVKHRQEVEGKSTAVHAPIIAPDHARIFTFPDIPDYDPQSTLLVFPGPESSSLSELVSTVRLCDQEVEEVFPYIRVVFIDSTWNQCYSITEDQRMKNLKKVIIKSRNTMFWRYQAGKPREYLATIEAIYYFCVDFHKLVLQREYNGEYDNLLFFFKFMYKKIHQLYESQADN